MENMSQALLMAGGVLIAILVISVGVYLFSSASTIGENYEASAAELEIDKFNSNFVKYEKEHYYLLGQDKIDNPPSSSDPNIHNCSLANYNNIYDVVTALNSAYDENEKGKNTFTNNYDFQTGIQVNIIFNPNDLEEKLSIEEKENILDKISSIETPFSSISDSNVYGITPEIQEFYNNSNINTRNLFYKLNGDSKMDNTNSEESDSLFYINDLIKKFAECKVGADDRIHRMYKYGFDGEVFYNEDTKKIDVITFTLFKNLVY